MTPVVGASVCIYSIYLQSEEKKIGDAITDSKGYYKVSVINSNIDQSQVKEMGQKTLTDNNGNSPFKYDVTNSEYQCYSENVSLIARVYDTPGSLIGSSSLVCTQLSLDIKMPQIILSLDVNKVAPSEYDNLINSILPLLRAKRYLYPERPWPSACSRPAMM